MYPIVCLPQIRTNNFSFEFYIKLIISCSGNFRHLGKQQIFKGGVTIGNLYCNLSRSFVACCETSCLAGISPDNAFSCNLFRSRWRRTAQRTGTITSLAEVT